MLVLLVSALQALPGGMQSDWFLLPRCLLVGVSIGTEVSMSGSLQMLRCVPPRSRQVGETLWQYVTRPKDGKMEWSGDLEKADSLYKSYNWTIQEADLAPVKDPDGNDVVLGQGAFGKVRRPSQRCGSTSRA